MIRSKGRFLYLIGVLNNKMRIKCILAFVFVFVCLISTVSFEFSANTNFQYFKINHEDLKYTLYIGMLSDIPTFTKETAEDCEFPNMTAEDIREFLIERDAVLCQFNMNSYQIWAKVRKSDITSWDSYSISDWIRESTLQYASLGYSYSHFAVHENYNYSFIKILFKDKTSQKNLISYSTFIDGCQVEIVMEVCALIKGEEYFRFFENLFEDMVNTLSYKTTYQSPIPGPVLGGEINPSNYEPSNSSDSYSSSSTKESSNSINSSERSSSSNSSMSSSGSSSNSKNSSSGKTNSSKNNSNNKVHIKKSSSLKQGEDAFSAAVVWVVFNSINSVIWFLYKLKKKEIDFFMLEFPKQYLICNLLFLALSVVNAVVCYFCFSQILISFILVSFYMPFLHILGSIIGSICIMMVWIITCYILNFLSWILPVVFKPLEDRYSKLFEVIICNEFSASFIFELFKFVALVHVYYVF